MADEAAAAPALSGTRVRAAPQLFVTPSDTKELSVPEGKGEPLSSIPQIADNIANAKKDSPVLKALHNFFYGKPGKATEIKRNLLLFNGLVMDTEQQRERYRARAMNWTAPNVKAAMDMLDICRSARLWPEFAVSQMPTKEQMIEKMLDWLADPSADTTKTALDAAAKKSRQAEAAAKAKQKAKEKAGSKPATAAAVKAAKKSPKKAAAASTKAAAEGSGDESEQDSDADAFVEKKPKKAATTASTTVAAKPAAAAGAASAATGSKRKPIAPKKQSTSKKPAAAAAADSEDDDATEDEEPAPPKKKAKASSSSSSSGTAKSKSSKAASSSSSSSSAAAQPTTAELRAKVADIMQEIDKDSVTFKQFNAKLEAALGCSLAERKAELKELLHAAMEDQ